MNSFKAFDILFKYGIGVILVVAAYNLIIVGQPIYREDWLIFTSFISILILIPAIFFIGILKFFKLYRLGLAVSVLINAIFILMLTYAALSDFELGVPEIARGFLYIIVPFSLLSYPILFKLIQKNTNNKNEIL